MAEPGGVFFFFTPVPVQFLFWGKKTSCLFLLLLVVLVEALAFWKFVYLFFYIFFSRLFVPDGWWLVGWVFFFFFVFMYVGCDEYSQRSCVNSLLSLPYSIVRVSFPLCIL
jgi:hypothetical protein